MIENRKRFWLTFFLAIVIAEVLYLVLPNPVVMVLWVTDYFGFEIHTDPPL